MKQHMHSIKTIYKNPQVVLLVVIFILCSSLGLAEDSASGKMLIMYYSRTGNTRMACEELQKSLGADLLEIRDLKNRAGGWGFFTGAVGSLFGLHTTIEPAHPDLAAYQYIIIASPIWTGKLSTPIRTLIDTNRFDGKKVILFTTTNALEKEEYREKSKAAVAKVGGSVVGYYQVAVQKEVNKKKVDRSKEDIVADSLKCVPEIKKAFFK
jgi:flavodoxin